MFSAWQSISETTFSKFLTSCFRFNCSNSFFGRLKFFWLPELWDQSVIFDLVLGRLLPKADLISSKQRKGKSMHERRDLEENSFRLRLSGSLPSHTLDVFYGAATVHVSNKATPTLHNMAKCITTQCANC